MRVLTVSQKAGEHLERWADLLLAGRLELWQLPRQVAERYHLGWVHGSAQLEQENQRLEAEVNYWYYQVAAPESQRKATVERQLVARLENASMDWWQDVEQLLNAAKHSAPWGCPPVDRPGVKGDRAAA